MQFLNAKPKMPKRRWTMKYPAKRYPAWLAKFASGRSPALPLSGAWASLIFQNNLPATSASPASLGQTGNLEVRLARTPKEIRKAQKVRYKVFYKEMSAIPTAANFSFQRDWDPFDKFCEHVLVFDNDHRGKGKKGLLKRPKAVGTYRILTQERARDAGGFYSESEYAVKDMIARNAGLQFMELGRSCVLPAYRSKRTVELLWKGIWSFARMRGIDVMIGCASFPGTDIATHAQGLSFLHHFAPATGDWAVRAHDHLYVDMNLIAAEDINKKAALKSLPPLIKGYLRLGAMIGNGAVVDHQFGTTDVMIILPVANIADRYFDHFGGRPEPVAAQPIAVPAVPALSDGATQVN